MSLLGKFGWVILDVLVLLWLVAELISVRRAQRADKQAQKDGINKGG